MTLRVGPLARLRMAPRGSDRGADDRPSPSAPRPHRARGDLQWGGVRSSASGSTMRGRGGGGGPLRDGGEELGRDPGELWGLG